VIDTSNRYVFTKEGAWTDKMELAKYFRKYKLIQNKGDKKNMVFRVIETWNNNMPKARYSVEESIIELIIGEYKCYYENGRLKYETYYKRDEDAIGYHRSEPYTHYYENGQKMAVGDNYRFPRVMESQIEQYWDSTGAQLVIDGKGTAVREIRAPYDTIYLSFKGELVNGYNNGIWKAYHLDGSTFAELEYKKGAFIKGTSYDHAHTAYPFKTLFESGIYYQNRGRIEQYIIDNLTYEAHEYDFIPYVEVRIQPDTTLTTCLIKVSTTADAKISSVSLLKGVNKEIDAQIIKLANQINNLKIVRYLGQPCINDYYVTLALTNEGH
jgi:antitoxin component YwqK of YwqJK toxin-antitoxin module